MSEGGLEAKAVCFLAAVCPHRWLGRRLGSSRLGGVDRLGVTNEATQYGGAVSAVGCQTTVSVTRNATAVLRSTSEMQPALTGDKLINRKHQTE